MTKASSLTSIQIGLVQQSWTKLVPIGDVAVGLFYDRLFEINPELRPMFKEADLTSQRTKLMQAINMVVMSLDKIDTLIPTIKLLGKRHHGYGVEEQNYEQVGAALLWALETGLGKDWNEPTRQGWINAYHLLSSTMISGTSNNSNEAA